MREAPKSARKQALPDAWVQQVKPQTLIPDSAIAGYSAAQAIKRTDPGARVTLIKEELDPTYSAGEDGDRERLHILRDSKN